MPSIEYEEVDLNEDARDEIPEEPSHEVIPNNKNTLLNGTISAVAIAGSLLLMRGYIAKAILPAPAPISTPSPDDSSVPEDEKGDLHVIGRPQISPSFLNVHNEAVDINYANSFNYAGFADYGFINYHISIDKNLIKQPFIEPLNSDIESIFQILNTRLSTSAVNSLRNSTFYQIYSVTESVPQNRMDVLNQSRVFSGFDIVSETQIPISDIHVHETNEKAILIDAVRSYISSVIRIDPNNASQMGRYVDFWQDLNGYVLPGYTYEQYLYSLSDRRRASLSEQEYKILSSIFSDRFEKSVN